MKMSRLLTILLLSIQLMLLVACNGSKDVKDFGVVEKPTTTTGGSGGGNVNYPPPDETHRLKIFKVGQTTTVGPTALLIGDTLDLRAVLVDSTGAIVTEVAVTWYVSGSLIGNDLVPDVSSPEFATYVPSQLGSGLIQAVLTDSDIIDQYNVATATAAAGTVTVSLALVPDQIILVSGDHQTSQVGSFVPQDFKVKVVNAGNTPVPGINVTFSVLNGGGQIVSAQPSVTDSLGEATCSVKLGGQIGADQQHFAATISSGSVTQVIYTATATVGTAAKLAFSTHPGGANQSSAFSVQPVVEVQDLYGNRVTLGTYSVALGVQTGSGSLTGVTTVSSVNGLATFTNVGYNITENNVVLSAAASGLTTGLSQAFDVGALSPATQCAVASGGWSNTDGGCKNATQGLVWSASSVGLSLANRNWHNVVWDSTVSGAVSQETWQLASTPVITMDTTATGYDISGVDYCQSLNESGMTDWRVPTWAEWSAADVLGAYAALKNSGVSTWTGTHVSASNAQAAVFTAGATGTGNTSTLMTTALAYRCVRRPVATKLMINQQVSSPTRGFGVNVPFENTIIIRAADGTNSTSINYNGNVTIGTTGTGQLCYTNVSTGVTSSCAATLTLPAVNGIVSFPSLSYTKAETIQLIATAPSLASVTSNSFTINQTYPEAQCKVVGGTWINAVGGCKSMVTGRIFSAQALTAIPWHSTIWDQATSGNAASQEISDNGRTYEYGNATGGIVDISGVDYCHDLQESGQSDWRVPALTDFSLVSTQSLATYTKLPTASYIWTSSTNATTSAADYWNVGTNTTWYVAKTSTGAAACVRNDPPAQLVFTQQPAGHATYGFGAGLGWTIPPVVEVRDADGATMANLSYLNNPQTAPMVTLTVTGGTGNLWYNNINYGTSFSVPVDTNGRATFTGLSYDKANETITLTPSLSMTWQGQALSITSAPSNPLVFPAIYDGTKCNAIAGWASQDGGCRDLQANGKVWSHTLSNAINWYDVIWDSTLATEDPADAFDGGLVNDYDPSNPAPAQPAAGSDTSSNNVCHRLRLNGYSDWRVPTTAELVLGLSNPRIGYQAIKNVAATNYVWSASTQAGTPANANLFYMVNGTVNGPVAKIQNYGVVCIRNP